ncbi:MAG: cell wall-binding repeat-containing protein [Candidatus Nanohaloarchaea archaeon]|nr:cell wall-binding repeat-containing protein [Candidatus Nanohaloarchaea archaeon]
MNWRNAAVLFGLLVALAAAPAAAQETQQNVDTVILASTENYPDALVSSSAAAKTGMPVLLTEKNQVPQETMQTLQQLQPSEIIMIGGPAVISKQVETSLAQSYNVSRLWGTTRYGTAVEVAEQFWVEGAEEAVLVQNSFQDQTGEVIASAKELASEEEDPIYLTPEKSVPASVLSSLQNLGVERVTVVGTNVTAGYRDALQSINVSIEEEITGDTDDQVTEKVEEHVSRSVNASEELIVVASPGFRTSIAASHFPNSVTLHVRSEEKIQDAVTTVNNQNVSEVKVVGRPQLARSIAEKLREETDAEVELAVARAAEAVRLNANLTEANIPSFARAHRRKMQDWRQERERLQQKVRERTNKTIQRAENLVGVNASEDAKEALQEARSLFAQGKNVEAREKAQEALNGIKEERYEEASRNATRMQERIREEVQTLQERVKDLHELNREFAGEMQENMTVEERLEVIEEFKGKRREHVRELMRQAQKIGPGKEGWGERMEEARERMEMKEKEFTTGECRSMVREAQRYADRQGACSMQTQTLECDGYTYRAENGCEISYLKSRGWEAAEEEGPETNETEGPETNETSSSSFPRVSPQETNETTGEE